VCLSAEEARRVAFENERLEGRQGKMRFESEEAKWTRELTDEELVEYI
jgi:hypothetical protein